MAAAMGCASASRSWVHQLSRKKSNKKGSSSFRVSCILSSAALNDSYKTLKILPGASEFEVKKAFRQLALQYHPDVCTGMSPNAASSVVKEVVQLKGLRDDTTCIVVDIKPPEKPDPLNHLQRSKGNESLSLCFARSLTNHFLRLIKNFSSQMWWRNSLRKYPHHFKKYS